MSSCVVDIQGMKCQSCVRNIEKTIGGKLGVTAVKVDLEKKEGTVQYDGELLNSAQIAEYIGAMGFTAKVKQIASPSGKNYNN